MAADAAAAAAGTVCGLRFTGDPLPALIAGGDGSGFPLVRAEVVAEAELERRWAAAGDPQLLLLRTFHDGRPFMTVHRDEEAGYRIWAVDLGSQLVGHGGGELVVAFPPADADDVRLLVAQAYPLLAGLHGFEPLHAGASEIEGRLVAIAARAGTGKSSTIAQLVAQGADFFADDVLTLTVDDGRLRAFPGPRRLNVAADQLATLAPDAQARLGRRRGATDKVHFEPSGPSDPRPLDALLFLQRRPGETADMLSVPDAWRILANASLPYLETPDRLRHQLEVVSALGRLPIMRVVVGEGESAAAVAARIRAWVSDLA